MALTASLIAAHGAQAQSVSGLGGFGDLRHRQEQAITLTGEEFTYDRQTDTFIARGKALLVQGASQLSADQLQYQRSTREALALGKVHLTDPDAELTAAKAEIDLDNETGELTDAKISSKQGGYTLAGSRIRKLLGQHYAITDGSFTTCGCERGRPSWSFSGKELDVSLGGKGTVRDARFNILDHPVLRIPYAVFPADTARQSGFLSPRLGQSRERGFQITQPYYIDIDKSSDATIAVDVETSARVGVLGEYRLRNGKDDYVEFTSAFYNENIRKNPEADVVDKQIADPHIPEDRYGLIGLLREHLTPNLVLYGDGNTVSDSLYLREMNVYTLSRGYGSNFNVLRSAPSDFGLQQSFSDSFVRLRGIWNQDLIQPQQFSLQYLPELTFSGRRQLAGGLAFSDYDFQAVNFWRSNGVKGDRIDLNPRVVVPFRLDEYFFGYADAGTRETVYDTSGHTIGIIPMGSSPGFTNNNGLSLDGLSPGGWHHRELPYAGGGLSTILEKMYDFNHFSIQRLKHTIEPVVDYTLVPSVKQNELPLFDEIDRVEPRSLLTYGLVSRIFARSTSSSGTEHREQSEDGETVGDGSGDGTGLVERTESVPPSGSTYELARLTLLDAYDTAHRISSDGSHFTNAEGGLIFLPSSLLSLASGAGYDPQSRRLADASASLTLRAPAKSGGPQRRLGHALVSAPFIQVIYTFVGGAQRVEQISGRAFYEVFDRFGLFYQPNYDIENSHLLSSEYGVRVKSTCSCWIVDVGVTDKINPREVQVLFQLTLGGVGSAGRNPFGSSPFGAVTQP